MENLENNISVGIIVCRSDIQVFIGMDCIDELYRMANRTVVFRQRKGNLVCTASECLGVERKDVQHNSIDDLGICFQWFPKAPFNPLHSVQDIPYLDIL